MHLELRWWLFTQAAVLREEPKPNKLEAGYEIGVQGDWCPKVAVRTCEPVDQTAIYVSIRPTVGNKNIALKLPLWDAYRAQHQLRKWPTHRFDL